MSAEEIDEHLLFSKLEALVNEASEDEEKVDGLSSFINRIIQPILLVYAIFQGEFIIYGQGYYVTMIFCTLIALFAQNIEGKLDKLILKDTNKNYANVLRYFKNFANYTFFYFIYLVVKMFNDLFRRRTADEPWNFTNIIIPVFFILFLSALKIIISEKAYEPLKEIRQNLSIKE